MKDPHLYNQDWYAISYSLAAAEANESARVTEGGAHHDPERAERLRSNAYMLAIALVVASARTLDELAAPWWRSPAAAVRRRRGASRRRRAQLHAYLEDALLPATLLLLAGVTKQEPPSAAVLAPEKVVVETVSKPAQPVDRRDLIAVVADRRAPRAWLVGVVEQWPRRAPRVDYNLACVHAADREWDASRDALRRSIEATPPRQRNGLADRAAGDPTLEQTIKLLKLKSPASRDELLVALGLPASPPPGM